MQASHLPYKGFVELTGLSKTRAGRWLLLLLGLATLLLFPAIAVNQLSPTTGVLGVVLISIAGSALGVLAALHEEWWEHLSEGARTRWAVPAGMAVLLVATSLGLIRDVAAGWVVFSGAGAFAGAALATSAAVALGGRGSM